MLARGHRRSPGAKDLYYHKLGQTSGCEVARSMAASRCRHSCVAVPGTQLGLRQACEGEDSESGRALGVGVRLKVGGREVKVLQSDSDA